MSRVLRRATLTREQKLDLVRDATISIETQLGKKPLECFKIGEDKTTVRVPVACNWPWLNENALPTRPKAMMSKRTTPFRLFDGDEQVAEGQRADQVKHQTKLMKVAIEMLGDSIKGLSQSGLMFALPTGYGKTKMTVWLTVVEAGYKTLVMCHNSSILDQWEEEYKACGLKVQRLSGKKLDTDADVYICGVLAAATIPWEETSEIGCVVYDEAHIASQTAMSQSLLQFDPLLTILCTGTRDQRSDGCYEGYEKYVGKNVVVGTIKKTAHVNKCLSGIVPDTSKKAIVKGREMMSYTHALSSVYNSGDYIPLMTSLVRHVLEKQDSKLLVILERSDAVDDLSLACKDIPHALMNRGKKTGVFADVRLIIAIHKMSAEGIDIPGLTDVMIGNTVKDVRQRVGRVRDLTFHLWIVVHNHKCFQNHWDACIVDLQSNAVEGGYHQKTIDMTTL